MKDNLKVLTEIETDLYQKDFLLSTDKSLEDLLYLSRLAGILKQMNKNGVPFDLFKTGLAISIFRDKSTRTRFSFASAVNATGLGLSEFDESKSQIEHGETLRETANMISFLTEIIGIRDDMLIGEGHKYMCEVSEAIEEGFDNGVLHKRPNIINLQCDVDHPTQTIADLLKLRDYFGSFKNLTGKKIAMTWAYSPSYGKPLSVPQGIISLMTRFGMEVTLAYPEGYNLIPEVEKKVKRNYSDFKITNSMEEAFKNADAVYPKSWAPFNVMAERTSLLKKNDINGLEELEKKCLEENKKYRNWTCNEEKMKLTKGGNALYMHCLPADISGVNCEEGEVSKEVFEKYRIHTYSQASFKPFVIAAMILSSRFDNPAIEIYNSNF